MMEINNNGKIIKVYPSDESELTTGVMTSGKVVLHFRSDQDIKLEQGATIEFLGNTYTLIYPQETKKLWRGYLEYIATFYSSAEQLKHKLLKDPSNIARTSFVFAGSPTDFATLVARSMGHEWSVGNCVATSYDKTIAFKEESCWAALGRVAEEFHTEWVIEGKNISLRKDERYKEDPLPLSYGKGNGFLSGVSQRGNADNLPISRLYVLGSSRNIDPTKYGASTLHLPKSWSGDGMRTDEAGNYIELLEGNGSEGAMELSALYPHRVGVVSSVVVANEAKHFYDIIDTSIPEELNYNDYRIRGEKAILKFETGALAGRQFEIRQSETALSGYHHQERRFELIPSEQDGFIMPSREWAPKTGDKYAIFGIALPQEYVTRAENELLKEAIRTLSERSLPQFTFEGEVDGIWAKRKWLEIGGKLVPGGHVLFSDPEFHPEGTVIRITSMAQKVNNPTAPSITLSTALVGGSLWNVLNRAEAQEVLSQKRDRELQRSQRQSYEQALEHIGMVERAVEGVEGFSKRIKPSVIETMGLLVGSQATQLDFVERYGSLKSVPMAINYNPNDKRITISNAFIRHQTIGITSITNARKPTDYRYWSVSRYTSPALTELEQSYYIYAKVEREGKGGNYLLSPEPLPFETTTHYHLLIGTLSSVIDGDRAYNRLYGFSMVTPGQILTDTISSANGNMTIDLQNGSIISDQIEFRRPDGSTKSVEEVITDTVQVGGRNLLLGTATTSLQNNDYLIGRLPLSKNHTFTVGERYTLTYRTTDGKRHNILPYNSGGNTALSGRVANSETRELPDGRTAITFDWRVSSDGNVNISFFRDEDRSTELGLFNVKLEQGTVATDWTPAPEDVQAEIANEAKAREAGDKALSDNAQTLQQALDALRESGANDNATLTDLINKANQRLDNLQEQADGEVSNWFYPGAPAPDKAPEKEWTTNGLKARHIGDTYTSTDESGQFMGKSWRYTTEFKWQEIHDTLVSQALAQASKAQTTADGKSTTFLVKPTKYEDGDTWVLESSQVLNGISYEAGTMLFAKQGSSAFVESHWVDKVRYIGATQLKESEEASKRAWEAYANAQAEAERVKAEAHADGIVTAEEQARIQATNKALETAKAYAEAQDKLLEERQKAYADGVLTEAEKRAIDVAEKEAKLAETNAKAYSDGVLTEAEKKAIAQAQKAYDDAVAKAKELDGQIQVGGRNLAVMSRMVPGYLYGDHKRGNPGDADYKVLEYGEFHYDPTYYPIEEGVSLVWVVKRIVEHKENPVVIIHWHNENKELIKWDFGWWKHPEGTPRKLTAPKGTRYYRVGITHNPKDVQVMLERGTVATDWTPAPEDVQAEIDAINANPPRINQTTKNWEVYVPSQGRYVDTGRTSVGDDGKAPKIVDGYWYEWDSNKGQYTNTGIKAQGAKGDGLDIKDTRNDNQLPSWYRKNYRNTTVREFKFQDVIDIPSGWRDGSYCMLETTVKWADTSGGRVTQKATLNSGQELYRVGTSDDAAWGEWSNLKAEVQEINAGLSNANTLIATLEKTAKELKEGKLDTKDLPDLQYLLNALQKGDTKIAGGLVLTNSIILSEPTTGQVMASISGTVNTGANALRLGIQYPDSVALATLLDSGKVSFGSDITTDEQREQSLLKQGYSVVYKLANIRNWIVRSTASTGELTTLRNDGTGHIGQLHFDSDRIVVAPIGDISKAFMEFGRNVMKQTIQEVLRSNAVDTSTTLTNVRVSDSQTVTRTFRVMNDNTSVTIDMDLVIDREVGERLYRQHPYPKQMIARLDDEKGLFAYNFQDWEEDVDIYDPSDGAVYYPVIQASTTSVHKTVILHQGTHTLTFYTNFGRGGANNIKVSQKYSTSYRQTSFSDRGMRIFGGGNSFVDFNHDHPQGTTFATIGGGLKVDYIDTPGVPLCGVMVRSSGTIDKSFGRYKNKWGAGQPQVDYDYSTKRYTVHHSIPHDHYIPTIQVTGYSGNNGSWSLTPRVFNISSYSFEVAIITNNDNYTQNGFSYTCFLAE